MSDPVTSAKRLEADRAREHLLADAQELQARLKVDAIAERALERVREQGERAADGVVAAVKRRPVAASAAGAGLVALLAIGPIARLVRWRRGKDDGDA